MGYEKPRANNTNGRKWTSNEENELLRLGEETDLTIDGIAKQFNDRSRQAVKNKLRKLRKREGLYNSPHQEAKYRLNEKWIEQIVADRGYNIHALEGYSGTGGSAEIYLNSVETLICCEIDPDKYEMLIENLTNRHRVDYLSGPGKTPTGSKYKEIGLGCKKVTCYNENVNDLLHRKVGEKKQMFDFIDLDPCGSPFFSIPQAIRLIEDGFLAVTYGDLQLQRWGRDAPLTKAYRMPKVDSFEKVIEYMIGWTMFEGIRQEHSTETRKVELEDFMMLSKKNTGVARVLYRIKKEQTLADVMNHLENTLRNFEAGGNPAEARFDLGEISDPL